MCPSCKQGDKLVHHYLLDCPTWRHKRWHLGQEMGQDAKSEAHILSTSRGVKVVLKYVGWTERFKKAKNG